MKIILSALIAIMLFVCTAFAQNEGEEIALITYYPAPYGEYEIIEAGMVRSDILLVRPNDPNANPIAIIPKEDGLIISDSTDNNRIKQWDLSLNAGAGGWKSIGVATEGLVFDSGWFAINRQESKDIEHTLGYVPKFFECWFSSDENGSTAVYQVPILNVANAATIGYIIMNPTDTQFTVYAGKRLDEWTRSQSGYYRIYAR